MLRTGCLALLITIGCADLLAPPSPLPAPDPKPAPAESAVRAIPLANAPVINLAWPTLPPDPGGYTIDRSREEGGYVEIARVWAPQTRSYTDVGLAPNTRYTYRVRPLSAPRSTAPTAAAKTTGFRVFDCTDFTKKTDLKPYGIEPINLVGGSFSDEPATRQVARRAAELGQILVIDIEHLPDDIRTHPLADVQNTLRFYHQIIDWVRDERPSVKLGFYGTFPRRDYWTAVNYAMAIERRGEPWWDKQFPEYEKKHRQWQAANDVFKPLADRCDYIFPSLYTFYDKPTDWPYYAKANLLEAKRYGKPVIPFIWMDYHDGTALAGQHIGGDVWRLQLETIRKLADGVVIWGGWHFAAGQPAVREQWDESAAWWLSTKQFLATPMSMNKER
jgi:hypothetical protein